MTWRSINCAYVRLAQIVGLNRMVDTVYRMSESVYLYPGQPAGDRPAGAEGLAAVRQLLDRRQRDVADGHGVGRPDDRQRRAAPRAVLRRVDRHRRRAAHLHPRRRRHAGPRPGRRPGGDRHAEGRAASRAPAATTRSTAAARPPARRAPRPTTRTPGSSASRRRSRRRCGWATRTATRRWSTCPSSAAPTRRACRAAGTRRRSGRRTWTQALAGLPFQDWELPPPPARPAGAPVPARQRVPVPHASPRAARSLGTVPPAAAPSRRPARPASGTRNRRRRRRPPRRDDARGHDAAGAAPAPPTATTLAPGTPITAPVVTRRVAVDGGTTVPPDVLDPRAPIPSTPLSNAVGAC